MHIVIIPDCHFPFHSKKALKKIIKHIKANRKTITHVLQIGDLLDQYSFSKYARSSNITTPAKEIKRGLKIATKMWAEIHKAVPKAKLYQLLGNHDARMQKRIQEKCPELESLFDLQNLYTFPNVITLASDKEYLVLDKVAFCHGFLSKSIDHASHFGRPTCHGHRHRPEIATKGRLWSLDVGFIADVNQLPLQYTASKKSNWRMAFGEIIDRQPKIIFL